MLATEGSSHKSRRKDKKNSSKCKEAVLESNCKIRCLYSLNIFIYKIYFALMTKTKEPREETRKQPSRKKKQKFP